MFKADLHVHSDYSPDALHSIPMLAAAARRKGIAAIALCDHNTIARRQETGGVLVLYGEEVSCEEGHVCVLGVEKPFPRGMKAAELVSAVHEEGGVAIASHPYSPARDSLRSLSFRIGADAVERFNGADFVSNLVMLDRNIGGTGGSDAHTFYEVGNAYTLFECGLSEADILEAIRKGEYAAVWSTDPLSLARRHAEKLELRLAGLLG